MTVNLRMPRLPAGAGSNLLGVVGLLAVVLAVGGLTSNWWWSLLAAGAVGVMLAVLAQREVDDAPTPTPLRQPAPRKEKPAPAGAQMYPHGGIVGAAR